MHHTDTKSIVVGDVHVVHTEQKKKPLHMYGVQIFQWIYIFSLSAGIVSYESCCVLFFCIFYFAKLTTSYEFDSMLPKRTVEKKTTQWTT